jgi:hypothetical protein
LRFILTLTETLKMAEAEQTLFGQAPPFTQRVMNTLFPVELQLSNSFHPT